MFCININAKIQKHNIAVTGGKKNGMCDMITVEYSAAKTADYSMETASPEVMLCLYASAARAQQKNFGRGVNKCRAGGSTLVLEK